MPAVDNAVDAMWTNHKRVIRTYLDSGAATSAAFEQAGDLLSSGLEIRSGALVGGWLGMLRWPGWASGADLAAH